MNQELKEHHWLYRLTSSFAPELVLSSICFVCLVLCNMLMYEKMHVPRRHSLLLYYYRLSFSLKALKLSPSTVIVTTWVAHWKCRISLATQSAVIHFQFNNSCQLCNCGKCISLIPFLCFCIFRIMHIHRVMHGIHWSALMLHVLQAVASYFVFGEATQDALWLTGDRGTSLLCTDITIFQIWQELSWWW